MEIRTLADLLACAPGTAVVAGDGWVWQLSPYPAGAWFTPGSEIEKSAEELIEAGTVRVLYDPQRQPARVLDEYGDMDSGAVGRYLRSAIGYVLATAAGSSQPEAWRTLSGQALTEALAVHLLAGLHPVLFEHVIALDVQVERAEPGRPAPASSGSKPALTAYDRYRPVVELESGSHRYALECTDCRDWEGWAGVRVWTAPERMPVDLADLIRAADAHEREHHPTGCRCERYDCNHDKED